MVAEGLLLSHRSAAVAGMVGRPCRGDGCVESVSSASLSWASNFGNTSWIQSWKACSSASSKRRVALVVENVGWDPEGILAPPKVGHIARRQMQKSMMAEDQQKAQKEQRRRAAREARVVPEKDEDLVAYFLATEKEEVEFEVARLRPRMDAVMSQLKSEIGGLRFAINQTKETEERMAELQSLEKTLTDNVAKYDSLAGNMLAAKERLARLLAAKDKKATLLDMVGNDEVDRPLLALLDENIIAARTAKQEKVVEFMEKLRTAVVKYITI